MNLNIFHRPFSPWRGSNVFKGVKFSQKIKITMQVRLVLHALLSLSLSFSLSLSSLYVMSNSCNHMDLSLPGSSVHGILQAILKWIAISFSRESSQPRDRTPVSCTAERFFTNWATGGPIFHEPQIQQASLHASLCVCVCVCVCVYMFVCMLSCVWLFATPWTIAHQAPLTMEFSRQKY